MLVGERRKRCNEQKINLHYPATPDAPFSCRREAEAATKAKSPPPHQPTSQPGFSPRHPTTSSHIQAKKKSPRRGLPPFNPFPPPSFLNPHVYTNFQHPLLPLDLPQDKKGEKNLVGERKARWQALPRREKRVNALPTSPLALEPGVV